MRRKEKGSFMKSNIRVHLGCVCVVLALLLNSVYSNGSAPLNEEHNNIGLLVHVIDVNGRGIRGVPVWLHNVDTLISQSLEQPTDDAGYAVFHDLSMGSYEVSVPPVLRGTYPIKRLTLDGREGPAELILRPVEPVDFDLLIVVEDEVDLGEVVLLVEYAQDSPAYYLTLDRDSVYNELVSGVEYRSRGNVLPIRQFYPGVYNAVLRLPDIASDWYSYYILTVDSDGTVRHELYRTATQDPDYDGPKPEVTIQIAHRRTTAN